MGQVLGAGVKPVRTCDKIRRSIDELASGNGQPKPLAITLKQVYAQVEFELVKLTGNCGLGNVKLTGGR